MNKDIQVQSLVNEFCLITVEQLKKLEPRQGVRRNLRRLVQGRQIYCRVPKSKTEPYVFAPHKIDRKSQERIPHDLMITDIHIALRNTGLLRLWEQGKSTWRGKIHQDAFCIIENPNFKPPHNKFHFFIEADTGVETYQEIGQKLRIYAAYPDKPFRVLFVTKKPLWASRLAKAAQFYIEEGLKKFFFFAQEDEFLDEPLGNICSIPYEAAAHCILPKLYD